MSWMPKARLSSTPAGTTPATGPKPGPVPAVSPSANMRVSNGLKEFLWLISDVPRARVLDLGPVWQSTISFFVEKGYRITTEDLLRQWKDFINAEEEQLRTAPVGDDAVKLSPQALAEKFLETSIQYPEHSFHGVLLWDLLDYFDVKVLPVLMERINTLLSPGGTVLALFHSRPAESFHRYRIVDTQTVELLPARTIAVHSHVFQNREILELFAKFRSSKTFVGRDQVRESLFLK